MFNETSWPFYFIVGVILWVFRYREVISKFLADSKIRALCTSASAQSQILNDIYQLGESHEVAFTLCDLVRHDGASCWPPRANHNVEDWPVALRGYKQIYVGLATLLPTSPTSLDDNANRIAIDKFRADLRDLLQQHVDICAVSDLLNSAEKEKTAMSAEIHNALYSCIAWCRHAWR